MDAEVVDGPARLHDEVGVVAAELGQEEVDDALAQDLGDVGGWGGVRRGGREEELSAQIIYSLVWISPACSQHEY